MRVGFFLISAAALATVCHSFTPGISAAWAAQARSGRTQSRVFGIAEELTSSPAFLEKKAELIKKEIQDLEKSIVGYEEDAKREQEEWGPQLEKLQQEFAFLKKRDAEQSASANIQARLAVVQDLLPIFDNFDRAKDALELTTDRERDVAEHYAGILIKIEGVLEKFNVKEIEAVGQAFDPTLHEAIQQMPSMEHKEDVVCMEFQRGFTIEGRLIRPAIVAVSMGPGP